MSSPKDFPWTDERLDRLRLLWADGWTASQIGRDLGTSRNSVMSKVRRIALPLRDAKNSERQKGRKKGLSPVKSNKTPLECVPSKERRLFASGFAGLRNGPKTSPQFPKLSQQQKDFILGVPLEALTDHRCGCAQCISLGPAIDPQKCKWPLDNPKPGKEFCGAKQSQGSPYCEHHSRMAGGGYAVARKQVTVIRDAVERLRRS